MAGCTSIRRLVKTVWLVLCMCGCELIKVFEKKENFAYVVSYIEDVQVCHRIVATVAMLPGKMDRF